MKKVMISISGPQGTGKTILLDKIRRLLPEYDIGPEHMTDIVHWECASVAIVRNMNPKTLGETK